MQACPSAPLRRVGANLYKGLDIVPISTLHDDGGDGLVSSEAALGAKVDALHGQLNDLASSTDGSAAVVIPAGWKPAIGCGDAHAVVLVRMRSAWLAWRPSLPRMHVTLVRCSDDADRDVAPRVGRRSRVVFIGYAEHRRWVGVPPVHGGAVPRRGGAGGREQLQGRGRRRRTACAQSEALARAHGYLHPRRPHAQPCTTMGAAGSQPRTWHLPHGQEPLRSCAALIRRQGQSTSRALCASCSAHAYARMPAPVRYSS